MALPFQEAPTFRSYDPLKIWWIDLCQPCVRNGCGPGMNSLKLILVTFNEQPQYNLMLSHSFIVPKMTKWAATAFPIR